MLPRSTKRKAPSGRKALVIAKGYIYILLNRAFQNDHYKIGMTTKKPEEQAQELSGATGVPPIDITIDGSNSGGAPR